ncbi:MAG: hypothetical protein FWE22_05435 [Firmicutes bacterium]|nr:hypothetical protein [Bacillota bacterium]
MDINTLLPLLMNRGSNNSDLHNKTTASNDGADFGGDMMQTMLMQMLSKDKKMDSNAMITSLIKQRLQNENPQMAPMVQLLTTNLASKKKGNEQRKSQGFTPIKKFVPNEILGIMSKLIL